MRFLILAVTALILSNISAPAVAFEIELKVEFGDKDAPQVLRILSTSDVDFFAPTVLSYLEQDPETKIVYTVASSSQIMQAMLQDKSNFDLVISSAMDLQMKLVNDGYAQSHKSEITRALPEWAIWNDSLFAFTQEAAVVILSNTAFDLIERPQTREEIIAMLRENPEVFSNRIGTYDIRQSGLGYLFATQDARASDTYWRLTEVIGQLNARLYCCSSDMIEDVLNGTIDIAYNVLGSYAGHHPDVDDFTIIYPSDMTTVMQRTVFIPKTSEAPSLAGKFLDHMIAPATRLPLGDSDRTTQTLNRITLGPGLLVYLDKFKKRKFLKEWSNAIDQRR